MNNSNHFNPSNTANNFNSNKDIMRKREQKSSMSLADKKIVQTCLEGRSKIHLGLKLLKGIIHECSSKLVIAICSLLSKKIRSFNR